MFKYGSVINDFSDKEIYKIISQYYDDPKMTKVENNGTFGVYIAKMPGMLINENRYIYAMILNDSNPIGSQSKLSNLSWDVFQARITDKSYKLSTHYYNPKRTPEYAIPITKTSSDEENTFYSCEKLPIEVMLIHPKKNFIKYPDNGTISAALETYRTVITHK
jgi:hypothetical protein